MSSSRSGVRLDKFLQLSRLVRRRTLANRLCQAGRVTLNGRPAAPAAEVHPGDIVAVSLVTRRLRARVRSLPTGRAGQEDCVDVLEDRPPGSPGIV